MTEIADQVQPSQAMVEFDCLIGTWEVSGGITGTMTYEWLAGGHFLKQTVRKLEHGHLIEGVDVIGHTRPWRGAPSVEVVSRFYDSEGNTLDYVYEIKGHRLTIWAGDRGSDTCYEGLLNGDQTEIKGHWHFPGGGGYDSVMKRIS